VPPETDSGSKHGSGLPDGEIFDANVYLMRFADGENQKDEIRTIFEEMGI